jgi:hypothetical protein
MPKPRRRGTDGDELQTIRIVPSLVLNQNVNARSINLFGNADRMAAMKLFATIKPFDQQAWRSQPTMRTSIRSTAAMSCNH